MSIDYFFNQSHRFLLSLTTFTIDWDGSADGLDQLTVARVIACTLLKCTKLARDILTIDFSRYFDQTYIKYYLSKIKQQSPIFVWKHTDFGIIFQPKF